MSCVVGLDLSLSATGWATADATGVLRSKHRGVERLVDLRDQVLALVGAAPIGLVIIEGYSFNSRAQGEHLGELGGVIRVALYEAEVPFAVVAPALVKKYATGRGNAPKPAVLAAAVHRSGVEFSTTDEADAFWLYQMGAAFLGEMHVEMPKDHIAALAKVDWPCLRLVP